MAVLDLFGGKALNPVDKKGRVSVPAGFRATIGNRHKRAIHEEGYDPAAGIDGDEKARHADAGRVVTIVKDPTRPCLEAYEPVYARRHLREKIEARHAEKPAAEREQAIKMDSAIYGAADPYALDVNGRIMLPPRVCNKIGIDPQSDKPADTLALFYAFGDTFEIWSPYKFIEAYPELAEGVRDLLEDRGL